MGKTWIVLTICLIALFLICSCVPGEQIIVENKRVTFALVIDIRDYNGEKVYANVLTEPGGTLVTTVDGVFESYPNTATHAWARMTTLDELETNKRYFLDFFIDMDDDGVKTTGDLTGIQHFEVMPSAIWSETKYFSSDLETVP
jgi:hypothetical protein